MLIKESKLKSVIIEQIKRVKLNIFVENRNKTHNSINEMLSTIPVDLSKIDGKNVDKEILRVGILSELDAINLYEQLAENATSEKIKKVLLDIAKEEKTHVGEFQTLLNEIDSEHSIELENGKKEVEDLD
jgi:rubrerythrin